MKKISCYEFLKNNWPISVVYLIFITYLLTGFGINNPYKNISEIIHHHSYIPLLLLLIQYIIWNKSKKFTKSKIILLSSLIIINTYLLCDSYIFSILIRWLDIEKIGWLLNALSVTATIVILIQSLAWLVILVLSHLRKPKYLENRK